MKCEKCQSKTKVVFTFPSNCEVPLVNRKRKCSSCGHSFETIERVIVEPKAQEEKGASKD